jgi:hypothetical protein
VLADVSFTGLACKQINRKNGDIVTYDRQSMLVTGQALKLHCHLCRNNQPLIIASTFRCGSKTTAAAASCRASCQDAHASSSIGLTKWNVFGDVSVPVDIELHDLFDAFVCQWQGTCSKAPTGQNRQTHAKQQSDQ